MALFGVMEMATAVDILSDLVVFIAPLWIAVIVGVVLGWAWKPKWADNLASIEPTSNNYLPKLRLPSWAALGSTSGPHTDLSSFSVSTSSGAGSSSLQRNDGENEVSALVTEQDLKHLSMLVEEKDGGPAWIQMMDRSTPTMSYQAWRRDPETGPPQYRSRTVYEDATPELLRDFFWDDEYRLKWDDMLIHASTLQECPVTGTMMVHWVRKFPFFCSDREYIIGRRIWDAGQAYYCVTKGVPCPSMPRHNKPKRVDLYYSSWCIRPVKSRKDDQLTACEVLLFHHEDMDIP